MGLSRSQPLYTVEQYLSIERASEERHEFLDGEIYAMAGESSAHAIITVNLVITVGGQLKGTECQARSKDTKVRSGPSPKAAQTASQAQAQAHSGLYSYPDLVVVCGEPLFHDEHKDVILNPKVIFEVLSPSTEAFDRGEKFKRYQMWNPTLSDYLLVSQDRAQVEHFLRQSGSDWTYRIAEGGDAKFAIDSIQCTLWLADTYDRIDFLGS